MKWLFSILIVLSAAAGFAVPITGLCHDFQTDVRTDNVYTSTGPGAVTADIVLFKSIYADDSSTLSVNSSISESPVITAYTAATKTASIGGLTANTSRTISLSYEVDALGGSSSWTTLLGIAPYLYYLILVIIMAAGPIVIFVVNK